MRTNSVQNFIYYNMQVPMYSRLDQFSKHHPVLGRVCSIPAALVDVTLETLKTPLSALELTVMTIVNLAGAFLGTITKWEVFSDYTVKDAKFCFKWALKKVLETPFALLMAVPFFIYQISFKYKRLYNPDRLYNRPIKLQSI